MVVIKSGCFLLLALLSVSLQAAILAPDRAEVLYHSYQGGGMKIDGPAVKLRKKASESVALTAFYYMDTISSASVDVLSTASEYAEERQEAQLGIEYLHNKTTMAVNFRQSDENDYLAKSVSVSVSHDTFGDLTTVNLGLSYGDDEVKRNGDENFLQQAQHYKIRAGLSQILTRNLTAQLEVEAISDSGFLNNPYRTVRFIDPDSQAGVAYQAEIYPNTRNSFTSKLSASYYLPYRAALIAHYRYFSDSWQITAQDVEVLYRHPLGEHFEFEFKARQYQQTQAEFYQDLFPYRDAQNYLARDKELSEFSDITLGIGATYLLPETYQLFDWRSEVSVQWDYIQFDYQNFRDPTAQAAVGEEPLYQFSANVLRIFASIYF
ncbi:DUF3570 domain-containing protein [Catenovulum sediminis]|uniref:DUF3570 domain-containing protein n=1 Tax=Catenovulum sediminis TaxID=1740262 RepID=A0ABV1RLB3_9ALTE|nr:DUF3570 domain-containing protein [Catenovulum sediminis]